MSQRIVDLDAAGILTQPIKARIGGKVYTLPGDVPAPLFAKIIQVEGNAEATPADLIGLYEQLLKLFQEHDPSVEELPIGITEMVRVIGYLYMSHDEEAPTRGAAGEDPTGRKRPAKKRAAKRKPAASRSRSST